MESSCPPTWSAAPCRNDAEERRLSTRTRSRCSDCSRWNLACLASGRAMAFERAWTQTGSRTCRRAAVRYCSLPPSVACPGGSQLQPRTPSRIIRRTCQRPRSDSVDRCCFESPRSRSAVSNARPPVSFIRRQSNGITKLRRGRKKERSSIVSRRRTIFRSRDADSRCRTRPFSFLDILFRRSRVFSYRRRNSTITVFSFAVSGHLAVLCPTLFFR